MSSLSILFFSNHYFSGISPCGLCSSSIFLIQNSRITTSLRHVPWFLGPFPMIQRGCPVDFVWFGTLPCPAMSWGPFGPVSLQLQEPYCRSPRSTNVASGCPHWTKERPGPGGKSCWNLYGSSRTFYHNIYIYTYIYIYIYPIWDLISLSIYHGKSLG